MKSRNVFWCIVPIVVMVGVIEGVFDGIFMEIFPAVLFFLTFYTLIRVAMITEEEARKDKYLKFLLTFMIICVLYCLTKDFYYFFSRLSPLTDSVRMIVILNVHLLLLIITLAGFYYKYYRPKFVFKKRLSWRIVQ